MDPQLARILDDLRRRRDELRAELDTVERGIAALTEADRSVNVQDVTSTQRRRGKAIARARAESSEDKRRKAIAARWGSQAKAAKAAGISQASLVGYLDGLYPVPRRVAKLFAVDAGLPATAATWPRGVVD